MLDFPANPQVGDVYQGWAWDGEKWSFVGGGSGGGSKPVWIGDDPPDNPEPGDLWWCSSDGQMYVLYADVDTSQWVAASSGGGSAPSGPAMGVTDGSDAAPGEVGEVIKGFDELMPLTTSGLAHVTLPPGDWDVYSSFTMYLNYSSGGDIPVVKFNSYLRPIADGSSQYYAAACSDYFFNAAIPVYRASLTAATTFSVDGGYFLVIGPGTINESSSNKGAMIMARRVR
jgi:hypothetical protein